MEMPFVAADWKVRAPACELPAVARFGRHSKIEHRCGPESPRSGHFRQSSTLLLVFVDRIVAARAALAKQRLRLEDAGRPLWSGNPINFCPVRFKPLNQGDHFVEFDWLDQIRVCAQLVGAIDIAL